MDTTRKWCIVVSYKTVLYRFHAAWIVVGVGNERSSDQCRPQALEEVGNNERVQTTLEGILGPDPALAEISTLTARSGCQHSSRFRLVWEFGIVRSELLA